MVNSKYQIRYLNNSEYPLWDNFVENCSYGTIFHKTEWLVPICRLKKYSFKIAAVFEKNTIVAGFAICYISKFKYFPIIVSPVSSLYYGFLIDDSGQKQDGRKENGRMEIADELIAFLDTDFDLIVSNFVPEFLDIRPFSWKKYNPAVVYTYRIKIESIDDIFANFDSDIKRRIKKTTEGGYELKINNLNCLDDFYNLQILTFKRQELDFPWNEHEFALVAEPMIQSGKIKFYTVFHKELPVSSAAVIIDKKIGYYWMAGGNPGYYSQGFNQILILEILKDLEKNNIKTFDFVGANTRSITKYKMTYNLPLIPFYTISKINSPLLKCLLSLKILIRKIKN
jgi:hypothetical protein